jgi:trimethylamine--corrinoid protein Co-methyltransferase
MEMAVICDEVFGMVLRVARGVRVDDETLAVDVIKKVGPRGQFFSQKHTLRLIEKELFIPTLFDKRPIDTWIK